MGTLVDLQETDARRLFPLPEVKPAMRTAEATPSSGSRSQSSGSVHLT